jgi:putative lysine transport system substrate-binding protein
MKKISLLLLILMLIGATCFVTACDNGSSVIQEEEEGLDLGDTLVVGMDCNYPPYNWTQDDDSNGAVAISNESGYANGYDVQIALLIGEALDIDIEIVKLDRGDLIDAVRDGDIDVMIAGVNPLESRADRIDFTESYYDCEYVVVVKKDGDYADATSINDFENARLTAETGSYIYDSLLSQMEGAEMMDSLTYNMDMRVALANGVIDGYVTSLAEGISATEAHSEFAMVTFNDGESFDTENEYATVAIGVTKGREKLVEVIDDILDEISVTERNVLMDDAIYSQPDEEEAEE